VKLVLTQDVAKVGKIGDVKEVADGYARNYLLPRGMAVEATNAQLKRLQEQRIQEKKREDKNRAELQAVADRLTGATVTFAMRVGEGGKLYGSISSKDVGDALEEQAKIIVDRRRVELEEPIRTLGTHQVAVHVASDLRPLVTVIVQEE
jgi:large subunit ribosomal protein L9